MRGFLTALAIAGLAFVAACGDDDGGQETPSATNTAAATATATATVTPAPSPTSTLPPDDGIEVPSVVQVVEVASGAVTTIYEDANSAAHYAAFNGDRVVLGAAGQTYVYELDGTQSSAEAPNPPLRAECLEVEGEERCGLASPDGRWMTYEVGKGADGSTMSGWDQWMGDLESGETWLAQAGLMHCGGCDGRYGPRWSPSGRYLVFAELISEGRRFLADAVARSTRQIGSGTEVVSAPAWSPAGDILLYGQYRESPVIIDDLAGGTVREIDLVWPAAFDASGEFIYSPAWAEGPGSPGTPSTAIVETATGNVVHTLSGAPPYNFLWSGRRAVARTTAGLMAALQGAPGCAGTAVYVDGALETCVEGGMEGQIGPDGSVAVARLTGTAGPVYGPGYEARSISTYDVDIVSPDGAVTTVVTGVYSFDAPSMEWNEAGTFLLVRWPAFAGL